MSQCAITVARDARLLHALAESGCTTLSFGLESITPASLESLNKGWSDPAEYQSLLAKIADAGIDIATEMIVGAEHDTPESLRAPVDFILRTPIVTPKFYILTPIPGTDLYHQYRTQNRLTEEDVFIYSPSRAVITHPSMTTEELQAIFWEIYDRLYTVPNILRRTLFHRRFLRDPGRYLFFLLINLFYRWQIRQRIAPIIM